MTNLSPIEPAPGEGAPPQSESAARCRVKVGSADGVLAVVPHLLGFHPSRSLVILGAGGPHARVRLAFRYDLPDPPEEGLAADIASHAVSVLGRQHLPVAVVIGYGPGPMVTPVVDVVRPALREAGIGVPDMLRVQDGRYWSYVCQDPACCPPDGVPFDPAAHPAAEALAAAGLTVRGGREELASTLDPDVSVAAAMRQAISRARDRAGRLITATAARSPGGDLFQDLADSGRRSVRLAVTTYRRGQRLADLDEVAWLGVTLTDLRVRDDAWARMVPAHRAAHQRLWTDLVRQLPREYAAAPASLLAFTAWQAGDGALASIAIERALDSDPRYSMALLLAEALHAGLPPAAARLPMTPKQVAASYAGRRNRPVARPADRVGPGTPGLAGCGNAGGPGRRARSRARR